MTEEINYKELAEELYLTLKENPWSRGYENCNKVIKKYEELHKPKRTLDELAQWGIQSGL